MKIISNKIKINTFTYLFFLFALLSGYIKNVFIIFFICIIHELGHIFFIKLFKYKINYVELLPFGGFTNIDKRLNTNINKDMIIAIGGIISQLFLGYMFILLKGYINTNTYNLVDYYNKLIIIFNLVPIIPLDGSKIINLLLNKYYSYRISYIINGAVSIGSLIIFLLVNYIYNLDNYFIILFLIYKYIYYFKNYKYIINRFLLERYLYDHEYFKIECNTKEIKDLKMETYHYFNDSGIIHNEREKLAIMFDKGVVF